MRIFLFALAAALAAVPIPAAETGPPEGRLLRFPDIHRDSVVFVYGGDIWQASTAGGPARRLTSHAGPRAVPEDLARRPVDRLQRRVHRHPPGVRDAGVGRRAAAAHLLQRRRPHAPARRLGRLGAGLDAGGQDPRAHEPGAVEQPDGPVLRGRSRGRPGDAAGAARGRQRVALRGREEDRLHADRPRVPHLEAHPRRARAGHLDLRLRGQPLGAPHRPPRHRQLPDVVGRTPSTSPPTASAR